MSAPRPPDGLEWYTYREAADVLRVSYHHVRRLMVEHDLPRSFRTVKRRFGYRKYALISADTLRTLATLTGMPIGARK